MEDDTVTVGQDLFKLELGDAPAGGEFSLGYRARLAHFASILIMRLGGLGAAPQTEEPQSAKPAETPKEEAKESPKEEPKEPPKLEPKQEVSAPVPPAPPTPSPPKPGKI